MVFSRLPLVVATLLGPVVPVLGQGHEELLFTTLRPEQTRSLAPPISLQQIEPQDVMVVQPQIGPHTARKHTPHDCLLTMVGDEDNDGLYWETVLGRKNDALLLITEAQFPNNQRRLFFSPQVRIGPAVSGVPIRPGDVARIRPLGQFSFFLTENQIRLAFGISAAFPVNVDAVTADLQNKIVYLSLEHNVRVWVMDPSGLPTAVTAKDGAILAIPVQSLFTEPVTGVFAYSGYIVATEAEVSAMVGNSQVRDNSGAHPTTIKDLDGLDMDPLGGSFFSATGQHPNLLFSGQTLTGGAVLSTGISGGVQGRIAQINGVAMANQDAPPSGFAVGLRNSAAIGPGSLNGLQRLPAVCDFVLETSNPVLTGGQGALKIDISGFDPGRITLMMVGFAPPLPPAAAVPMIPFFNPCFPERIHYVWRHIVQEVPWNGDSFASWSRTLSYSNMTPDIVVQAVVLKENDTRFSTPLTIQLLP